MTWPLPPCDRCASLLINAGIGGVLRPHSGMVPERWQDAIAAATGLMAHCGVIVGYYGADGFVATGHPIVPSVGYDF